MRYIVPFCLLWLLVLPALAQDADLSVTDIYGDDPNILQEPVLSPDGEWVVGANRDGLCIIEVATQTQTCTPFPEETRLRGTDQFAWSADSTRVAMTENFFIRLEEPDIWEFDRTTRSFTNRTDDGVSDGGFLLSEDTADFVADFMPVYHPDGSIYFMRLQETLLGRLMTLQRLAPDADESEQVAILPTDFFLGIIPTSPMQVSPDGSQIGITMSSRDDDIDIQGFWRVEIESGRLDRFVIPQEISAGVPSEDAPLRGFPMEVKWITDDALVMFFGNFVDMTVFSTQYYYMDLETETITPVRDYSDKTDETIMTEESDTGRPLYEMVPRFGLVNTAGDRLYYISTIRNPDQCIYSVPLPPDDSDPRQETCLEAEIPGRFQRLFSQAGPGGRGLLMARYVLDVSASDE